MTAFTDIDIHELLPQREPFVMVGKLIHFDIEKCVTATTVSADNIFVEDGVFTPSGIIENMAQTCATRIGYINKYILKKGIQIGYIGAIRNMELLRCPAVGESFETMIQVEQEIFGMILANATVTVGDEVIARSQMKIAISSAEADNLF